jgi:hypothetical protein
MSIMKKLDEAAKIAESSKKATRITEAVERYNASGLAKRCPEVAEMFKGSKESQYQAANLVRILENTAAKVKADYRMDVLKEDVTSATAGLTPGVSTLTPRVVDIVNVFYPQMVANYICDIQALDRQTGEIFIIKTRYSQGAAGVQAGDIVFEKPTDGSYASEWYTYADDVAAATVTLNLVSGGEPFKDGASDIPTANYAVRAGSVRVYMEGKEIARDYGDGNVQGKGILPESGVDYATGTITLKLDQTYFADAIAAQAKVSAKASRDTEINDDTIRSIEFDVLAQPITAQEHPLMSAYSVASQLVMNAHLAIDADELISNQLAGTIRWERDLALIKTVANAAKADATLDFDCQANGENLTLKQRYSSYDVMVSTARGLIQETMGRGTVEYMIVSTTQGLPIVEQIEGFKAAPESKKPVGPYLAGTLRDGTVTVIAVPYTAVNPVMAEDEIIFGFKGFQMGDSAIILAEWVPLYFTPTFQAPNLKNHRGCLSFYDLFVNNPKYLVKGAIKNYNVA